MVPEVTSLAVEADWASGNTIPPGAGVNPGVATVSGASAGTDETGGGDASAGGVEAASSLRSELSADQVLNFTSGTLLPLNVVTLTARRLALLKAGNNIAATTATNATM